MRYVVLVFLSVFLSGCAGVMENIQPPFGGSAKAGSPGDKVSAGMTREVATGLMDGVINIGFEKDAVSGEFRPLKARCLYSSEILPVNGVSYLLDWYIVGPLVSGPPKESELFPLVYKDGLLVAKGHEQLEALKNNKEGRK
jgi:hypothetical protein